MLKKNSGLIISLLIGCLISLLYFFGVTSQLELSLGYDSSFLIKKKSSPNKAIKIIGIDQKSLEMIGVFPWRRDLYANLLKTLGSNPEVIGFDIILSERSEYPEDDLLFADVVKKSKPVILPVSLEPDPVEVDHLSFFFPLEEFAHNAAGSGLVNFFPDRDGISRKSPVSQELKDSSGKINIFSYEIVKTYMKKADISLPKLIYCNFQGRDEVFQTYSFYDVITGSVPPETFKDSIVLVGAMAEGLQDRISSPIGPMYGVLYHAQMVSNILNDEYINPVPPKVNILIIFVISMITFFFWKYFETVNQILLLLLSIVVLYTIHLILFNNNIWISIVSIILANALTFVSLILFSQFRIAKALKSELNKLITNYGKRNLQYKVYKEGEQQLDLNISTARMNSVDSNTTKVSILAEIGNTLTVERNFLETLLNNIKISIIVTDPNSQIILANPIAEKFFAKDNGEKMEIIGKRLVDISDSLPDLKSDLISVYAGEKELPVFFDRERGASMFNIRLLKLDTLSKESNIICLIEDVTDWHQMANKDGLTGLWNQRYFKDHLEKEIKKSQRYKNLLSLIIMDVDHFKSFNDTYGHQTGDIVLKSIAKVVDHSVRNTDIAARYGGEEFAIILPMTDEDGAMVFAERLRKGIERLNITDINGDPVRQVTSSLGLAFYQTGSVTDFIEYADKALYVCKHQKNRNCITKYSEIEFLKDELEITNEAENETITDESAIINSSGN
jgi:diguanylate cyclase (GGDEF)-like protein